MPNSLALPALTSSMLSTASADVSYLNTRGLTIELMKRGANRPSKLVSFALKFLEDHVRRTKDFGRTKDLDNKDRFRFHRTFPSRGYDCRSLHFLAPATIRMQLPRKVGERWTLFCDRR